MLDTTPWSSLRASFSPIYSYMQLQSIKSVFFLQLNAAGSRPDSPSDRVFSKQVPGSFQAVLVMGRPYSNRTVAKTGERVQLLLADIQQLWQLQHLGVSLEIANQASLPELQTQWFLWEHHAETHLPHFAGLSESLKPRRKILQPLYLCVLRDSKARTTGTALPVSAASLGQILDP